MKIPKLIHTTIQHHFKISPMFDFNGANVGLDVGFLVVVP